MGRLGNRVKLFLSFVTGVIECLGFAGVIAGWPSLVYVLKKEDYFADLCFPLRNSSDPGPRNGTVGCTPQDERFTLIFTIGDFVMNLSTMANGFLLDSCGIMATRFLAIFLYTTGTLMISFSVAASALLLFPALALIGVGGVFLLTTNIKVGNLFGRKRSTVITVYNGAFGSAPAIFLVVKVTFEAGFSLRTIFLFISCLSLLHVLRTVFLLPWKHIPYPLPEEFTYGLNCEAIGLIRHEDHRSNSSRAAIQIEGEGNERQEEIRGDTGEEEKRGEDEVEHEKSEEEEGKMGKWKEETEGHTRRRRGEQNGGCRREAAVENEKRRSQTEGQKAEYTGEAHEGEGSEDTEGDRKSNIHWMEVKGLGTGETEAKNGVMRGEMEAEEGDGRELKEGELGEWKEEGEWRVELKGEEAERCYKLEMFDVILETERYLGEGRGEKEESREGTVETEGISGDVREHSNSGVNLQHYGPDGSQVRENDEEIPTFRSCVFSRLFLSSLLWFSILQLRFSFFIGTLNPLLNLMTNGDPEQVSRFTNAFAFTQLFTVLCAPLNGLILDRRKWKRRGMNSASGSAASQRVNDMQAAVLSLALTVTLSVLFSLAAAIPIPEVQYLTFVLFMINRSFLYGGLSAFLAMTFPPCHFGKLYGATRALAAIVSLLQYPFFTIVKGPLQDDPLYMNIGFLALVALAYAHPINVFIYCRRSNHQLSV